VFWRCGKLQVEFNIPLSEQLDDLRGDMPAAVRAGCRIRDELIFFHAVDIIGGRSRQVKCEYVPRITHHDLATRAYWLVQ
jgi:hypothetical protein